MRYRAFGLNICSDITLSSLQAGAQGEVDVRIRRTEVSKQGLSEAVVIRPTSQISPGEFWVHVPNIAWFYVSGGSNIFYEPEKNADEQSVCLYLLGTCMGSIIHQRKLLAIHANAIRFGDHAILCAGLSGRGKSTLAAAFHQRGYQLLADDLSVVDEQCYVQPAYPQIKLWNDAAQQLSICTENMSRIRVQIDKYAYRLNEGFCEEPLPVKAVYILSIHNKDSFDIEPLSGAECYEPLKNQTFRVSQLEGLDAGIHHMRLCAKLASQASIARISRPRNGFNVDQLVSLIERDVSERDVKTAEIVV